MEEPRRLGNRYELGAVLGRGGMAEVYMARDIRLGRAVAVKTLRADMARDATFQARFRREAQSAASLNHPAIVAVYDTGEDYIGGISLPFIVMEYVDGSTLRDLLHSGRKLLPERSLEITGGVLQALDYSHRNGIVHRDIKPANVMLTRGGAVKVMDFGIARAMGDAGMTMTQTAAVIGTAQYLSPEQAKGEQVDARSDLYSTGCLIYELLTGRPPFIGDSPVAVAYQHVRETANPPSYYDPEVPPVVDAIVMKALAKHPDERYQSADEMRADLERALDGRPVAAAPTVAAGFGAAGAPTTVMAPSSGRGYGAGAGYGSAAPTRYEPTAYQASEYGQDGPEDEVPRSRRASNSPATRGKGKDKTGWIILSVVVVILVVLAVFVFKTVFAGSSASTGTVPTITGQTLTQAQATLKTAGYKLGTSYCGSGQPSNSITSGQILGQKPESGASASLGSGVGYCVSSGPVQFTLPSTVSSSLGSQVVSTLQAKGFQNVTTKTATSATVASNNAIDIQNANGTSLLGQTEPVTTPLVVVISGGPGTVTVPSDVVTKTCSSADSELTGLGLNVNSQFTYQTNASFAANTVITTTPAPNTQVNRGSAITITCSSGAGATTGSPTATASATATDTSTAGGFISGLNGGNNGGN
ncbi:Stk1 family PASTA domain-containing Ser/Thr kinase [Actinospica sp.]|uniref:Stk1 family PASTA domain-containing Ser/Thr kinase n=1 Tax=Actinospica sp. TaxID=1872142 RepID=UPI0039C8916B